MNTIDVSITVINAVLVVVSGIGAYKSFKYYKRNKHLAMFVDMKDAVAGISKMLDTLLNALQVASSTRRGFSPQNAIRGIGNELAMQLNKVMDAIPAEYSSEFRALQKTDNFELNRYINSLIDGSAIVEESWQKTLDRESFDACQECLRELQEFLKLKMNEEEKLISK